MSFLKEDSGDSIRRHGVEKSRRASLPIWNYHRYFEGYVERETILGNGKVRTERIYTAEYYCASVDQRVWIAYKLCYALLMAAIAVIFCHVASMRWIVNTFLNIALSQALFLGIGACLMTVVVSYMIARRKMTIFEYRTTSCRLRLLAWWTGAMGILLSLEAAGIGLFCTVDRAHSFLSSAQYALCSLAAWCMYYMELRLSYDRIPSEQHRLADDVEL